jgi:hypothetical protein
MNSIAPARPAELTEMQALNELQQIVTDVADAFYRQGIRFDDFDIACHIESRQRARIVAYVRAKCDWASVVADDLLMKRTEILDCYGNPEKFRAVVDDCLFDHFKNKVDWESDVAAFLVQHKQVEPDDEVRRYVYPVLRQG